MEEIGWPYLHTCLEGPPSSYVVLKEILTASVHGLIS